jgi:hypothetical protein
MSVPPLPTAGKPNEVVPPEVVDLSRVNLSTYPAKNFTPKEGGRYVILSGLFITFGVTVIGSFVGALSGGAQWTNVSRLLDLLPPGTVGSDKSLTVRCKNCGLGQRIYQTETFTRDLLDSKGNVLDLERMPDCPRTPSW